MMQDIRDALEPIPLAPPAGIPWIPIVAGVLAAALVVLGAIWIASLRVRRAAATTPEQAALRRLSLLQPNLTKAFYFELTAILLEYLDAQFPVGLTFCTSAEILSRLRSIEMMSPECEKALRDLLAECDRARFAPGMEDADPAGAGRRCRRALDLFGAHIASVRRVAQPAQLATQSTSQEPHVAV
jgi:hypothetical protein